MVASRLIRIVPGRGCVHSRCDLVCAGPAWPAARARLVARRRMAAQRRREVRDPARPTVTRLGHTLRSLPLLTAIGLVAACAPAHQDDDAPAAAAATAVADLPGFDQPAQPAEADDMHVFDPYIGRFRSKTMRDEQRRTDVHYFVEYQWFDVNRSIVRFRVTTVYADDGSEVLNAEGFYGHDPFSGRLYAFAAFPWGASGFGAVGEFDRTSHRRATWARSMTADGVTLVRDVFEVVDPDTWSDVTWVRAGADREWRIVYQDTFTRVPAAGPGTGIGSL